MKTGRQNNIFDYDTGDWNNTEVIKQDFRLEKPAFATVDIDFRDETFAERLYRLGKVRRPSEQSDQGNGGIPITRREGMQEKVQRKMSPPFDTPEQEWEWRDRQR
jgi:hypothetical protein